MVISTLVPRSVGGNSSIFFCLPSAGGHVLSRKNIINPQQSICILPGNSSHPCFDKRAETTNSFLLVDPNTYDWRPLQKHLNNVEIAKTLFL